MNLKAYFYHWTQEKNISSIQENGLLPTAGNYITGVYLSADPLQLINRPSHEALIATHLRGLEKHLIAVPDKKWVISKKAIPPNNLIYIGSHFQNEQQLKKQLQEQKIRYEQTNPRAAWPLRTQHIETLTRRQLREHIYQQP